MVQELKQSTAVVVHIGPFVDVGDGFVPETGVTLSGADEAEVLKHAATTTTSISGLTFAAITSCDGWYALSLGTGETDTLGDLEVIVQDDSLCLPVSVRFSVVTANYWDSKHSTDKLEVDVTQWLGTAAATPTVAGVPEVDVTHMEGGTQTVTDLKDFADAGYDPGTNKVQGVVLVDTTTANTDVRGTDSAALASVCTEGRLAELDGANLPTDVAAVKTDTAAILTDTGTDGVLLAAAATSAQLVDDVWDEILTGATHNISTSAGRRLRQIDAAFVITSGTAQAGAATTITLAAGESSTNDIFRGDRVIIIGGTGIGEHGIVTAYNGTTKVATMSETWVITPDATSDYELIPASVDVETWKHVVVTGLGDLAQVEADTAAILVDTADIQPKIGTPAADISADVAAVKVDTAATLVDTADMQPKIGSPAADVSADIAAVKVDTAAILVDTGTTLNTKIDDIQGATFSSATDSLEAIRDRGDAAWITGAGGSDPGVLQNTTIATLATQVSFTLTAGSADDNAYLNMLVVVEDSSTATQKAIGVVSAYAGATKTITLREDPGVFTMAVGDTIDVLAISPDTLDILADTSDMQPKLGSPAADVSADIAAVKVDTAAILVDTADMQPKIGAPAADLSADVAAVKTDTAAILVDTADIQPKLGTPAADLAADLAAVKTEADKIALADAGAGVAGSVIEEVENRALASVCTEARLGELDGANLPTDVAAVKTDTGAILVDTADMQPKLGAPAADVSADIAAVKVDTAAVLVDTGTTIPSTLGTPAGADMSADIAALPTANETAAAVGQQKNQTFSNFTFLMVLTSDGRTPATGLTVTGQRSLDAGAFGAVTGTIAEVSNGIYQIDASAADMNATVVTFRFSAATADDRFVTITTTP